MITGLEELSDEYKKELSVIRARRRALCLALEDPPRCQILVSGTILDRNELEELDLAPLRSSIVEWEMDKSTEDEIKE